MWTGVRDRNDLVQLIRVEPAIHDEDNKKITLPLDTTVSRVACTLYTLTQNTTSITSIVHAGLFSPLSREAACLPMLECISHVRLELLRSNQLAGSSILSIKRECSLCQIPSHLGQCVHDSLIAHAIHVFSSLYSLQRLHIHN